MKIATILATAFAFANSQEALVFPVTTIQTAGIRQADPDFFAAAREALAPGGLFRYRIFLYVLSQTMLASNGSIPAAELRRQCSEGGPEMANREQRGNKETRKPKKDKKLATAATAQAPKPGQPAQWKPAEKKS
jgi:hypothetical protein